MFTFEKKLNKNIDAFKMKICNKVKSTERLL